MSGIMPYAVVAAVILCFFVVCYLLFNTAEPEAQETSNMSELKKDKFTGGSTHAESIHSGAIYHDHTSSFAASRGNVDFEGDTDTVGADLENDNTEPYMMVVDFNELAGSEKIYLDAIEDDESRATESEGYTEETTDFKEDTIALGESEEVMSDDREGAIDATQMIGSDSEVQGPQIVSDMEETRLFDAREINDHLSDAEYSDSRPDSARYAVAIGDDQCVDMAMAPFLHTFGVVQEDTRHRVEMITGEALEALGVSKVSEVNALLDNIVIQEALMSMQKAYAATSTEWMKTACLEAFLDVVQSPKSSTPYLVAFDALRVLPHMTLGHFQVMALTLLLQYSRNSNNYGLMHFRHYVEKYIEPFISDLPYDSSFYRQLDYLRCTQQEREPITLAQLLGNSYPFVFNYRGFTKDELLRATDGHGVDPRFVVRSLNSDLYKLAMVDESMAPRFFRQTRISNYLVQRDLIALMKSKPLAFKGAEARRIMEDISPVLADLAELFDTTPMSSISLTLLGLYLGRAHVKATIGEEFDLSRWF